MRRALAVGINHYDNLGELDGCVTDAEAVAELLRRDHDGASNFDARLLTSRPDQGVARAELLAQVEELFASEADVALLFFAGHGTETNLGGYLVTSDAARYEEGLAMVDVLQLARASPVKEAVVLLDCCQAGSFGALPVMPDEAALPEGFSVLTASRSTQSAVEEDGRGLFSKLVCSALDGGAADTLGKVTAVSVYAYVEEVLGPWQQRPQLKAHVSRLTTLRNAQPSVDLGDLRQLPKWFPEADSEFPLDPSYEPEKEPRHAENEGVFAKLQKLRAAKLVEPVGEDHMYFAALNSTGCRLTALGQLYWQLARVDRI